MDNLKTAQSKVLLSALVLLCVTGGPLASQDAGPARASRDAVALPGTPTAPARRTVRSALAGLVDPGLFALEPPSFRSITGAYARRYGISRDLAQTIVESAMEEGIDPELGFRLVRVESRFKSNARGPAGALGLTQLMPGTARSLDRTLRTDSDIMEPKRNLQVGFRYLRRMIEKYDGDVRLGLLAYNRGETAVNRALRAGRDPENGYSTKVLGGNSGRYAGVGVMRTPERR